jgi:hypothetical protein
MSCHLILLDLIPLTILGEQCKLWSSSMCNFLSSCGQTKFLSLSHTQNYSYKHCKKDLYSYFVTFFLPFPIFFLFYWLKVPTAINGEVLHFNENHFNTILLSTPRSPKWSLHLKLSDQTVWTEFHGFLHTFQKYSKTALSSRPEEHASKSLPTHYLLPSHIISYYITYAVKMWSSSLRIITFLRNTSVPFSIPRFHYAYIPAFSTVYVAQRKIGQFSQYSDLGYGLDKRVQSLAGAWIFLFATSSILALGPTQTPIQWVDSFPKGKAARARSWRLASTKCQG